jgi:hypothetical protein
MASSMAMVAQTVAERTPAMGAVTKNTVDIHPNPSRTFFNIEIDLKEEQEVSMDLYDLLGNHMSIVLPKQEMRKGDYSVGLYAGTLNNGIYYLLIRFKDGMKVKRVIVAQ